MKKNRILIIGGTGFIGSNLIKKLVKRNIKITSISLNKKKIKKNLKVNYLFCDIANIKNLKKFIKSDFDYIINLSGNIDHFNKKKTYSSHYVGVKNLLNFFRNKKIKKFVQFGSSTEYGYAKAPQKEEKLLKDRKLKSPYSISKLKSTNLCLHYYRRYKLPVTVVRLFLAYGPGQKNDRLIPYIISSCLKKKSFNCSAGNQVRDYIYIDDVINFIIHLLKNKETDGEILNLGSGKPIKIKNVINEIHSQIKNGYPNYGVIKLRKDEPTKLYANIKKAQKFLNWKIKTNFNNGLKKTIKYYRRKIL